MLLSVTTTSLGLTVHKNFQVVTSKEFFPVKLSNLYSTYIYIFSKYISGNHFYLEQSNFPDPKVVLFSKFYGKVGVISWSLFHLI